ncbi:Pkinase-domain-containing protein, partial [Fistulina hepatica ATCC 64428]
VAVRKSTGERVVLKYEQKGSFKHQCRVMNGIKTSLDLHHPSIMRLYEAIDAGDTIVLVQEYITGDDLFQYIVDHGPMPEPLARTIFHQIASTVLFLHERHIVHRDLKPENVMVNDDGNIKLIDFGFSCDISNGALHTSSCGSPNYAAPEIVSGKPYRGPEIDTWSLGAVLYAMLCARMTFDGHVQDVLTNIKSGTYEKPTSLSPEAQNLIAAMLTVDPEQRITLAQVMNHPFIRNDEAEGAGRPSDVDKPLPRLPDDDSNDGDISLTVPQVVLGTSVRVERTGSNAEY